MRIIRQNPFWAFAYNTVGIPVAALGKIAPKKSALKRSARPQAQRGKKKADD